MKRFTRICKGNKIRQFDYVDGIMVDDEIIVMDSDGKIIVDIGNPITWPTDATDGLQAIVDVNKAAIRFGVTNGIMQKCEYVVSTYGDSGTVPKPKLKEFTSIEDAPPAPHIFDLINYWPEAGTPHPGTKDLPEGWEWKWFGDDWVLSNGIIGLVRDDWFKYNNKQVADQPVTAASMLQSALGHMEDRAKTYDAPGGERSMGKTVSAFNTITGLQLSEEQGWLFMEVLKQVRSQQGNYRADNYEDMVAYAALRGECAARERGDK